MLACLLICIYMFKMWIKRFDCISWSFHNLSKSLLLEHTDLLNQEKYCSVTNFFYFVLYQLLHDFMWMTSVVQTALMERIWHFIAATIMCHSFTLLTQFKPEVATISNRQWPYKLRKKQLQFFDSEIQKSIYSSLSNIGLVQLFTYH